MSIANVPGSPRRINCEAPIAEKDVIFKISEFFNLSDAETAEVKYSISQHTIALNLGEEDRFFLISDANGNVRLKVLDKAAHTMKDLGVLHLMSNGSVRYMKVLALEEVAHNTPESHLADLLKGHVKSEYVPECQFELNGEVYAAEAKRRLGGWFIRIRTRDNDQFMRLFFDEEGNLADNSMINNTNIGIVPDERAKCFAMATEVLEQLAKRDKELSLKYQLALVIQEIRKAARALVHPITAVKDASDVDDTENVGIGRLRARLSKIAGQMKARLTGVLGKQDPKSETQKSDSNSNVIDFAARRAAKKSSKKSPPIEIDTESDGHDDDPNAA